MEPEKNDVFSKNINEVWMKIRIPFSHWIWPAAPDAKIKCYPRKRCNCPHSKPIIIREPSFRRSEFLEIDSLYKEQSQDFFFNIFFSTAAIADECHIDRENRRRETTTESYDPENIVFSGRGG